MTDTLHAVVDVIRDRASRGESARYGGLIAAPTPSCNVDEVEGYGGHLVGESMSAREREHIASWTPQVAQAVADLLLAVWAGEAVDVAATKVVSAFPLVVQVRPTVFIREGCA